MTRLPATRRPMWLFLFPDGPARQCVLLAQRAHGDCETVLFIPYVCLYNHTRSRACSDRDSWAIASDFPLISCHAKNVVVLVVDAKAEVFDDFDPFRCFHGSIGLSFGFLNTKELEEHAFAFNYWVI